MQLGSTSDIRKKYFRDAMLGEHRTSGKNSKGLPSRYREYNGEKFYMAAIQVGVLQVELES
jgi:hypothetical protein